MKILLPDWVSIKHPNPMRDDSLLLVVKGEHCGKYVQRIHHKYKNGESQAIPILRVVNCMENMPEVLTEENLELDVNDLCLAVESAQERKAGNRMIKSIREVTWQNCAK